MKRALSRAAALAAFALADAFAQSAATVALVTDVEGNVRIVRGKQAAAAGIPADLHADSRLEVPNGARVVMLVLSSGEEATLKGPATATFTATSVVPTPAAALSVKTSSLGNVKLRKRDLSQAAIVMRNTRQTVRLPLLSLAGTLTLDTTPVFRWSAVEGSGPYSFSLMDASGREIFATRTEATQLALPSTVHLVEGRTYTWEVRTRRANGLQYSNFGDFGLAPAELRARAEALRPRAGASFSERVAYAVWLDSSELVDAARGEWRALSAERPREASLRQLAGP